MPDILVDHDPSPGTLRRLDIDRWPSWAREASTFRWSYDTGETCCLLEGEVMVTPDGRPAGELRSGRPGHLPGRNVVHLAGAPAGAQARPTRLSPR